MRHYIIKILDRIRSHFMPKKSGRCDECHDYTEVFFYRGKWYCDLCLDEELAREYKWGA